MAAPHTSQLCGRCKKSLCSCSRGTKAVYYDRQKPLDYLFPLKKGGCRIFSSHQRTRCCVYRNIHLDRLTIKTTVLRVRVTELLPDVSLWGKKPFVVLFSSLFSMAHLRNAPRFPFVSWNCCLVIHILSVNVLASVHITHLGGQLSQPGVALFPKISTWECVMGSPFPAGRSSGCLFILTLPSLLPHGSKWQYYSLVLFETETIICLGITRRALYYPEKRRRAAIGILLLPFLSNANFPPLK